MCCVIGMEIDKQTIFQTEVGELVNHGVHRQPDFGFRGSFPSLTSSLLKSKD